MLDGSKSAKSRGVEDKWSLLKKQAVNFPFSLTGLPRGSCQSKHSRQAMGTSSHPKSFEQWDRMTGPCVHYESNLFVGDFLDPRSKKWPEFWIWHVFVKWLVSLSSIDQQLFVCFSSSARPYSICRYHQDRRIWGVASCSAVRNRYFRFVHSYMSFPSRLGPDSCSFGLDHKVITRSLAQWGPISHQQPLTHVALICSDALVYTVRNGFGEQSPAPSAEQTLATNFSFRIAGSSKGFSRGSVESFIHGSFVMFPKGICKYFLDLFGFEDFSPMQFTQNPNSIQSSEAWNPQHRLL